MLRRLLGGERAMSTFQQDNQKQDRSAREPLAEVVDRAWIVIVTILMIFTMIGWAWFLGLIAWRLISWFIS
jgi:hypothetical protein